MLDPYTIFTIGFLAGGFAGGFLATLIISTYPQYTPEEDDDNEGSVTVVDDDDTDVSEGGDSDSSSGSDSSTSGSDNELDVMMKDEMRKKMTVQEREREEMLLQDTRKLLRGVPLSCARKCLVNAGFGSYGIHIFECGDKKFPLLERDPNVLGVYIQDPKFDFENEEPSSEAIVIDVRNVGGV